MREYFQIGKEKEVYVKSTMKEPFGDRVFNWVNFFFASVFFIIVFYPLLYVVSSSFSDPQAVISGQVRFLPVGFGFQGYAAVLTQSKVITGYLNSLYYMFVGTSFNIMMTVLAAYPLSRRDFRERNVIMMIFAFTMLFSGGLIPTFLLIRDLGLVDTRAVMFIPGGFGVINVIIVRTFFQVNVPDELLESAKMDGCTDFRFVLSVVLPLSGAIIAVQALFYSMGHWNAFFTPLIYLRSRELFPLQLVLREILLLNQVDPNLFVDLEDQAYREALNALLRYSLIVVASLPFMLMYPFVQKFFVKGVLIGSIKG